MSKAEIGPEKEQVQNHNELVPLKLNESWAGRRLMEALRHLPPSNFASSLDMRFQQRQIQDREHRKMELTGGKQNVTAIDKTTTALKTAGNGKVRQMFFERRRGVGIDRSNPLKPISTTVVSSSSATTFNKSRGLCGSGGDMLLTSKADQSHTAGKRTTVRERTTTKNSSDIKEKISTNGSVTFDQWNENSCESDEVDYAKTLPKELSSMSLDEAGLNCIGDFQNNSSELRSRTKAAETQSIKLNPVVTKKMPSIIKNRQTTTSPFRSVYKVGTKLNPAAKLSPVKNATKTSAGKMSANNTGLKPPLRMVAPPPGMATCKFCGRNFNEERLPKHSQVCERMAKTKRKIFDAAKHRVKGTEAEKFLKKPMVSRSSITASVGMPKAATAYTNSTGVPPTSIGIKKNNWRQKHEEFIAAIRAAKQVQAHLAKGGKLSDLPPPPPSENPDYIQCPHCLRRFNQSAAERHIPKCANMLHNKPKPGAAPQRRR